MQPAPFSGVSISSEDFHVTTGIQKNLSEFTFAQGENLAKNLKSQLASEADVPTGQKHFWLFIN